MAKIQYNDKVNLISQTVPEVNKVTAANLNEIKTSVNINVDNIALNATDLSLKADIGGNSSERFKVSTALTSDDAVNKEQLESLDTTLQNNIDLKANKASPSFTGDATFGGDVGVGTSVNSDYKLDIAGDARADSFWFRGNTSSSPIAVSGFYRPTLGAVAYGFNTNEFFRIEANGDFDFKSGDATFGGSVTASSFVGAMQENFTSLTANYTLKNSDYNVHNGQQFSVSALTIPTGLSTKRSWEISAEGFDVNITEASGVNITVIANGAPSTTQLTINGAYSARLVATATANEFLLIK